MAKPKVVGQVTIATRVGPMVVKAYAITEYLAIHEPCEAQEAGLPPGDYGWTISHRPTGYAALWTETLGEARMALAELSRPEMRWDFTTPLASVVLPGCCTRIGAAHRIRERLTGQPVPKGRVHGHRYQAVSP